SFSGRSVRRTIRSPSFSRETRFSTRGPATPCSASSYSEGWATSRSTSVSWDSRRPKTSVWGSRRDAPGARKKGTGSMKLLLRWTGLILLAATVACTASTAFQEARRAEEVGQWDLAVLKLAKAAELEPGNPQYRLSLQKAKLRASQAHFDKGKLYRASGSPE